METKNQTHSRKPSWLKIKLEGNETFAQTKKIVETNQLETICVSGKCPNLGQCWSMGTATFMILGDICTRSCKFCATKTGKPFFQNPDEPAKVAHSIQLMKLKYCVITSVDRDDLPDKGAKHWHDTIVEIRRQNPNTIIEVLIPDFDGREELVRIVCEAHPDIIGHNMETVERLTPQIRSRANYETSLKTIKFAAQSGILVKSGMMVGLGEKPEEVSILMQDLVNAGCKLFTIGQYLQPSPQNVEVMEFVHPDTFAWYKEKGLELGLLHVESAPLVRSSYMAEKSFLEAKQK